MSDFNEDDYYDGADLDENQDFVEDLCDSTDIEGFEDEFADIDDDSIDDDDDGGDDELNVDDWDAELD